MTYPKDNREDQIIEMVLKSHDYDLELSKMRGPVFKCKTTDKAIVVSTYSSEKISVMYFHGKCGLVTHSNHKKVENAVKAIIKFLG